MLHLVFDQVSADLRRCLLASRGASLSRFRHRAWISLYEGVFSACLFSEMFKRGFSRMIKGSRGSFAKCYRARVVAASHVPWPGRRWACGKLLRKRGRSLSVALRCGFDCVASFLQIGQQRYMAQPCQPGLHALRTRHKQVRLCKAATQAPESTRHMPQHSLSSPHLETPWARPMASPRCRVSKNFLG